MRKLSEQLRMWAESPDGELLVDIPQGYILAMAAEAEEMEKILRDYAELTFAMLAQLDRSLARPAENSTARAPTE